MMVLDLNKNSSGGGSSGGGDLIKYSFRGPHKGV